MSSYPWAHWAKTAIFGIGSNSLDVSTDGLNGKQFLETKIVNRTFEENSTIPEFCLPLNISTTEYSCEESDLVWGILSLACIQLPAVVMSLCGAVALLADYFKYEVSTVWQILGVLSMMLIPFPLLVLGQQIAHLFLQTPQMELLSAIFLYGEGSLEASPQLILQNYILMSDAERGVATIQILAIITAYFTIAKTSLELYASESGYWSNFGQFINHEDTCGDSLMDGKSLLTKLWTMVRISPAFLLSLVFKVGSFTIICTMLKGFSALYILGGAVLAFITAYKTLGSDDNTDARLGSSLFYSLCNITILSKCPLSNRKENYRPMMNVSLLWLAYHSLGLITIMLWHGLAPTSSHLSHWTTTRLSSPAILYSCSCSLLVIGFLSILALWGLKWTVKGMEDGDRLWDANWIRRT